MDKEKKQKTMIIDAALLVCGFVDIDGCVNLKVLAASQCRGTANIANIFPHNGQRQLQHARPRMTGFYPNTDAVVEN